MITSPSRKEILVRTNSLIYLLWEEKIFFFEKSDILVRLLLSSGIVGESVGVSELSLATNENKGIKF